MMPPGKEGGRLVTPAPPTEPSTSLTGRRRVTGRVQSNGPSHDVGPVGPVVAHDPGLMADDSLPLPANDLAAVHGAFWAAVAVGGPEFGTAEWAALDPDDPRAWAATVRGAFCWWAAEHDLGLPASRERLDALVEQEVTCELKAAAVAVSQEMSRQSTRPGPPHAELQRRRALPIERAGDHPGGPVPAWGPSGRPELTVVRGGAGETR